jgi:DNA-binding XRE family transcriptional regulator
MNAFVITPAQFRAARALVDWSQEDLARHADVGVGSVRDVESERRSPEAGVVGNITRALQNGGILFVPGGTDAGPGVRLITNRPTIIRRPTTMTQWEGLPFNVEWRGKSVTVFVSQEVLDDLGRLTGRQPENVYIAVFDKHRGTILDGVARAIENPDNYDASGRLYVRGRNIPELSL